MKIFSLLFLITAIFSAPAEHEIKTLKDYYDFTKEFKMYSGYLPLQ